MTDANGEFILHHPGAGEYYVVAKPVDAHVPSAEASPFPLETGDPVAEAARLEQYKKDFTKITVSGESPVEINLRVKNAHFGSISGRITNANGVTVAGANVHAMKTGERGFGVSQIADENGAYRLRGFRKVNTSSARIASHCGCREAQCSRTAWLNLLSINIGLQFTSSNCRSDRSGDINISWRAGNVTGTGRWRAGASSGRCNGASGQEGCGSRQVM